MNRPFRARRARRAGLVASLAASAALAVAACSGSTPSAVPTLPSIALPSGIPTTIPSDLLPSGSLAAGCLDPATAAIVNQLTQSGADVASIVASNKDALVSGLQAFQPTDQTVTDWRDTLVQAIQNNDSANIQTQINMLKAGQVSLSTC